MGSRIVAILLTLVFSASAALACTAERIELRGAFGEAQFRVEVADTTAERNRGLMFRRSLGASAGMLFVYPTPRRASFWMKNTLIPLDMIFADAAGIVTRVHANAIPRDLTQIDGGPGVQYVLEINGGLAAQIGIGEGAEMRHPAISQSKAAWPC
ncbi:DUF192 domain-containing protein [Pseudaestuariivita sp.]|uniref:DUF192 domain-containing protein n=1 Tax=Pseudaestuariivita sp. TaxID=2211669 RepID=UPI004059A878